MNPKERIPIAAGASASRTGGWDQAINDRITGEAASAWPQRWPHGAVVRRLLAHCALLALGLLTSSCNAANQMPQPTSNSPAAAASSSTNQAPGSISKPEADPLPPPESSAQARPFDTTASMHAASAPSSANSPHSDTNATRASYDKCIQAASGVTPEMKRCMGVEYAYQDNRLNKAYKALIASMDDVQRSALRREERSWLAYRTAHCKLDPNGGQAAELDAFDCSVQATAKQAALLQSRLHELESRH